MKKCSIELLHFLYFTIAKDRKGIVTTWHLINGKMKNPFFFLIKGMGTSAIIFQKMVNGPWNLNRDVCLLIQFFSFLNNLGDLVFFSFYFPLWVCLPFGMKEKKNSKIFS